MVQHTLEKTTLQLISIRPTNVTQSSELDKKVIAIGEINGVYYSATAGNPVMQSQANAKHNYGNGMNPNDYHTEYLALNLKAIPFEQYDKLSRYAESNAERPLF